MELSVSVEPPFNYEGRKTQLIFDVKILKKAAQLQQIPVTSIDPSPASSQSCMQNQIRGVAYGNYFGHRCHGCCTVAKMKKFQNRDMGLFAIYIFADPHLNKTQIHINTQS